MSNKYSPTNFIDNTAKYAPAPSKIQPGTAAIIFNDSGEVLLQKRSDNGYWGLPGGVIDIGEPVTQSVIREVLEETGLHVTVKRLTGIYSDPTYYTIASYPDGEIVHSVTNVFECEPHSGRLAVSDESTDIGYFPTDALPENTLLSVRSRVDDALVRRIEPYIR